jgi:Calcineurin-like phosphoesterase
VIAGLALAALAALAALPASDAWVVIPAHELQTRYQRLWAVSDIHGHREELERLLLSARLARRDWTGALRWDAQAQGQLLVVAGDLIHGGPDSPGVLRLLERLVAEAPASNSRVVVLLGNQEVEKLVLEKKRHPFLHSLPIAAFVGPWLFAHSGYIESEPDERSLSSWLQSIAREWARDGRERYEPLSSGRSIVDCHRWWESRERRRAMREKLRLLGLDAVVFGHDPRALGAAGVLAIDDGGTFLKLDAGLKENRSAGMLLRCDLPGALKRGLASCEAMLPDGALRQLPTVHLDP